MKDALVILGMGGPLKEADVKPFLKNLFSDREIIDFKVGTFLQKFIAGRIASGRAKKVIPRYELMGGGSPQLKLTMELAGSISRIYSGRTGRTLDTYAGMCYWHPFIEDTVSELSKKEYGTVYFLSMYPQFSKATSGICFKRARRAMAQNCFYTGKVVEIMGFFDYAPYIKRSADMINEAVASAGKKPEETHILFSAHSLPQYMVDGGDPYQRQILYQAGIVAAQTGCAAYSVAYQSKVGRMKWLEPDVNRELVNLKKQGKTFIVVVAMSFINDHIETLVEIDKEFLPAARDMGFEAVRAKTLNNDDKFAEAMTDLILGDAHENNFKLS